MKGIFPIVVMLVLVGCATTRTLMPIPAIYVDQKEGLFEDVPPALRTAEVDILFATDRQPEQDEAGNLRYGYGRSDSVAFGSVVVDLGHDLTWDALVKETQTSSPDRLMELSVRSVEEIGRFPPTPSPFKVVDNAPIFDRDNMARQEQAADRLRQEVLRRLALTPRKEVFIFVHGYNNTFDDAAYVAAEFWHFLGREGVPLLYTWPAGYPGLFGYTYDRESSEYTVFHMKQILRIVSAMPEVKGIQLVAHSRGTDVATAAVRELFIFARGAGIHPLQRYKIRNLVLAAPDLDFGVVRQRLAAEQLSYGFDNLTIYYSPIDGALGFAQTLFSSPRGRLGKLDEAHLTAREWDNIDQLERGIALIRFEGGTSDQYGHSYFRTNPSVSSDIILLLRYGLPPGSPERPLEKLAPGGFWTIPPGYPNVAE
jgi:esterase/lipase superfamily enzyme